MEDVESIGVFIRTFSLPILASATHLRVDGPHKLRRSDLSALTACLPAIHTLHTTELLLGCLGVDSTGLMFPALKTLLIFDLRMEHSTNSVMHKPGTLMNAVRGRERLCTLDLTRCCTRDVEQALEYLVLDGIWELEVLWLTRDGKHMSKFIY